MIDYYQRLFSIGCFHGFYPDGICHDLLVEPTDECMQKLRRHRLLFKQGETGGVVIGEYHNVGTAVAPILKPKVGIDSDTIFTFQLRLKNAEFLTITAVDQRQINPYSGFVFCNTPGMTGSTDGSTRTVQVHNGTLGSPVRLVGKTFRYAIAAGLNITTMIIHNTAGAALFQINLIPQASEINIDLTSFPEGIYYLHLLDNFGTEVSKQTVFASDAYAVPHLFGFLQVCYRENFLQGVEDRLVFSLTFENRKIPWVYTVDVKDSTPGHPNELDPNTIQLQSTTFAFTRSQTARRVTFTSDQPIPLQQQAYQGIQLIRGATPKGVLIPHMPNPEPSHLVKTGDSGFRAEMHLTVR